MGVKIITVQQNKDIRMAKEIKRLKAEWREALETNIMMVDIREARYDWYIKGIEDSLGLARACELLTISQEVI